MTPVKILASALLTYSICVASGQLLLICLKLKLTRAEHWFFGFLLGSACLSTVMFFVAALRWIYDGVLLALGAGVLLGWYLLRRRLVFEPTAEPPLSLPWRLVFWIPYLAFGLFYLATAMLPEISSDGTVYHVGVITRYYARHGFYPMRTDMNANMPAGIEMLFLYAYAFGRHSSTALVHLSFLLTLPFGMLAYARKIGQAAAGIVGSLLFYVAPVVGKDGTSAYNDVAAAALAFGCFYALELWRNDRRLVRLIPAGMLAGFCFACKYTVGVVIVYALLFVLFSEFRAKRAPWRAAAVLLVPALLIAAPWMIKNIAYVANPFYPFFNRFFPNPYFYELVERQYRDAMAHQNGVSFWSIPWQVTVGQHLIGIIGPVFLLAPLALLSLRSRIGRQVLPAFFIILLPFFGNTGTRFLIPSLPFLSLALAAGLATIPLAPIIVLALHLVLSCPCILPYWAQSPYHWMLTPFDWRAALRITPQEQYLEQHLAGYRAGLMLDRYVPAGELVYSPSLDQLAYHHRDLLATWESSLGSRTLRTFFTAVSPDEKPIVRRRYSFRPVHTDAVRLVSESKHDEDVRVSEVRFFDGSQELTRNSKWRLTASDDPWEVQLAFDNNPVSYWSSGTSSKQGMTIEVRFGAPQEITGIVVEQPSSQRDWPISFLAASDRHWERIQDQNEQADLTAPDNIRRVAAAAMKASGVEWILIRDGDHGAEDLRQRAPYWGAVPIAHERDFRLYKLE